MTKKKLVVMADDFGFSEAYNYGVIKAYEEGIVTCGAMLINLDTAPHAVELAKQYPNFHLTLHPNIVVGKCCADPALIPSIARPDGTFYRSTEYNITDPRHKKAINGTRVADKDEFKIETLAQMERFKELTGEYPIHMEVHSIFTESTYKAIEEISEEYGIHISREDDKKTEGFLDINDLAFSTKHYNEIIMSGVKVSDILEDRLGILDASGDVILAHFHPGYLDAYVMDNSSLTTPRCIDQQTLRSPLVKEWVEKNGIELVTLKDAKI